jgi:superoxide oxidase
MNFRNTPQRYGSLSIGLHWLMFLLLIAVYACIELRELYPKGSDPREALKTWHFMLGMLVFLLASVRIAARLSGPTPAIVPPLPQWQKRSARAVHVALYVLMLGLPLGGWLMLSAAGKHIPFFGLELPPLVGENKDLADAIKEIHKTAGTIGYFLIGVHVVAALFHHHFRRDNTLLRMLPFRE